MNNLLKKVVGSALVAALAITVLFTPSVSRAESDFEALQSQVRELLAEIQAMQQKLDSFQNGTQASSSNENESAVDSSERLACSEFRVNLGIGSSGAEVFAVQTALKNEGLLTDNQVTGQFDERTTASAVTSFQEKYASEILHSYNIRSGTGYVGPTTRAKLNALYGCNAQRPVSQTPPPASPDSVTSVIDTSSRRGQIRELFRTLLNQEVDPNVLSYWDNSGYGIDYIGNSIRASSISGTLQTTISTQNQTLQNTSSTSAGVPSIVLKANNVTGATTVQSGDIVRLSWTSANTSSCWTFGFFPSIGGTNGNGTIQATATGTYSVGCSGTNGQQITSSVTVYATTASSGQVGIGTTASQVGIGTTSSVVSSSGNTRSDQVRNIFRTLLKREPNPNELNYWVSSGYSLDYVSNSVKGLGEYQALQSTSSGGQSVSTVNTTASSGQVGIGTTSSQVGIGTTAPITTGSSSLNTSNQRPIITAFDGPSHLTSGQSGTWRIGGYDPDGATMRFSITYGDGASFASERTVSQSFPLSENVSHTFQYGGSYRAVLELKDSDDAVTRRELLLTVDGSPASAPAISSTTISPATSTNKAPEFGYMVNIPSAVIAGQSVQWTVVGLDPDGSQLKYTVQWGDGTLNSEVTSYGSYGQNIAGSFPHVFQNAGSYTITFTAQDVGGATFMKSALATVSPAPQPVTAVPPSITVQNPGSYFADGQYTAFSFSSTGISQVQVAWCWTGSSGEECYAPSGSVFAVTGSPTTLSWIVSPNDPYVGKSGLQIKISDINSNVSGYSGVFSVFPPSSSSAASNSQLANTLDTMKSLLESLMQSLR
ncbi:MAG: PKD domain-containing protein [Patescibacteria group bacterium]|nr:PKD domain-containing protein [Patescibacteria group bacterium]